MTPNSAPWSIQKALESRDTMDDAWKVVIWSLLACLLGEHPNEPWASDEIVDLNRFMFGPMHVPSTFFAQRFISN